MNATPVIDVLRARARFEPRLLEGPGFRQTLSNRIAKLGLDSESAYAARLAADEAELELLAGRIAVAETWLFRYPAAFELLVEHLRRRDASTSVMMLSVACATGEEAFSMAAAALHAGCDPQRTRIIALDRNPDSIATARRGELHQPIPRDPVPPWAQGWFQRRGPICAVDRRLLELIDFQVADALRTPFAPGSCTAIFCRNLLIYLEDGARRQLLGDLAEALSPQGVLFLGHADRSSDSPRPLVRVGPPQSFAYRRAEPLRETPGGQAAERPPHQRPLHEQQPNASGLSPAAPRGRGATAELGTASPSVRRPAVPATHVAGPRQAASESSPSPPTTGAPPPAGMGQNLDLATAARLADDGRLDEAAALLRSVVAKEGQSAGSCELLGLIALARHDLPAARRHFEESVYLEPRRASALLHLALLLDRQGERSRAAVMRTRAGRASTESA